MSIQRIQFAPKVSIIQTLLSIEKIQSLLKKFRKQKALSQDSYMYASFITAIKYFDDLYIQIKSNKEIDKDLCSKFIEICHKIIEKDDDLELIKIDDISYLDMLYNASLTISSYKLINQVDPFTKDTISPENRVVISSGHQFDVAGLSDYVGQYLISNKGLKRLNNPITNPFDNLPFSARDRDTIIEAILQYNEKRDRQNKDIDDVYQPESNPHEIGSIPIIISPDIPNLDSSFIQEHKSFSLLFSSSTNEFQYDTRTEQSIRRAILPLVRYGLTAEMLRDHWPTFFPAMAQYLLVYLVTGQGQPPDESYTTQPRIEPLSQEHRLSPALAIQEMIGLSISGLRALYENYSYGLRRFHLINWQSQNAADLSCDLVNQISHLFRTSNLSAEEVLIRVNETPRNSLRR